MEAEPDDRKNESEKKSRDALFMGLGDVIFPVCCHLSNFFLPDWGPKFGTIRYFLHGTNRCSNWHTNWRPSWICAADDLRCPRKPQPGLPLLNGGAILGYIISGIYAVGPAQLYRRLPSQRIVLQRGDSLIN